MADCPHYRGLLDSEPCKVSARDMCYLDTADSEGECEGCVDFQRARAEAAEKSRDEWRQEAHVQEGSRNVWREAAQAADKRIAAAKPHLREALRLAPSYEAVREHVDAALKALEKEESR
jgi:hypothetical protein